MIGGVDRLGGKLMAASIVVVLALVLAQAASAYFLQPKAVMHLNGQRFEVTIADTDKTRKRGLSGTSGLAADQAMLFINEYESRHGIWMKDMNYSIDIIWLDSLKKVVHMEREVSPDTYPTVFFPDADARYIVEFRSGTVKDKGLRIGQEAIFSGTSKRI